MIKGFAERYGIDFVKIDSNLSNLLNMEFRKTHVSRNISCVLMLQKLFGKFLYSSGVRYRDSYIGQANDQAYSDPASVHLLSTETTECVSTGSQYSRVEKTKKVISIEDSRKWLNVCLFPEDPEKTGNCSQCGKCMLTLFTLELEGVIEQYDKVFNLSIWRQQRNAYIATTILGKSHDPLVREVREYIKNIGYKFTFRQRLFGFACRHLPDRLILLIISRYRWIKYIVSHPGALVKPDSP